MTHPQLAKSGQGRATVKKVGLVHTLHRIRTTWLFVALLLSIVAATAPSTADSGLGGGMVLTGQVDLAGDSAGALDVVLPQDVQVTDSYGPDGTFEIQAGDPTAWVGFALLRTTPDGPTGVIGGRLPASAGPGAFLLRGVGPAASAGLRLDAGVYSAVLAHTVLGHAHHVAASGSAWCIIIDPGRRRRLRRVVTHPAVPRHADQPGVRCR